MATIERLRGIEREFALLSPGEQREMLGRLVHRVRAAETDREAWEAQLAGMAADPAVQRELGLIEEEFSVTQADGLGRG